jgi:hypothetical protein
MFAVIETINVQNEREVTAIAQDWLNEDEISVFLPEKTRTIPAKAKSLAKVGKDWEIFNCKILCTLQLLRTFHTVRYCT